MERPSQPAGTERAAQTPTWRFIPVDYFARLFGCGKREESLLCTVHRVWFFLDLAFAGGGFGRSGSTQIMLGCHSLLFSRVCVAPRMRLLRPRYVRDLNFPQVSPNKGLTFLFIWGNRQMSRISHCIGGEEMQSRHLTTSGCCKGTPVRRGRKPRVGHIPSGLRHSVKLVLRPSSEGDETEFFNKSGWHFWGAREKWTDYNAFLASVNRRPFGASG